MTKRSFLKTITAAFAAAALVSVATGAKAQALFPNGPAYGLVSIAASETLLLKLFNGATDTVASCTVRVDLIDAAGNNLGTATRTLAPGQLAMLDASSFTTTTTAVKKTSPKPAAAVSNISLRPQITFHPPQPCHGILSTFQITDMASGRTNRIAQAFRPPNPEIPPGPPSFGFVSTLSADNVRLNVVNTALSATAGVCQVNAGFVDSNGNVLQSQTASLGAGQSLILNQAGGSCLRPVVLHPPPAVPGDPRDRRSCRRGERPDAVLRSSGPPSIDGAIALVRHDVDGGVFHGLVPRRANNGK